MKRDDELVNEKGKEDVEGEMQRHVQNDCAKEEMEPSY